jgi:hypothetical protein
LIGLNAAWAQQQSGTQALRLAQSVYDQGRLHEVPDLIKNNINKFSKTELISAYRLLSLSYIYMEEPEKADESMQKLIATDHFYEPNPNVEPAEYIGLYKTFRTKPVFNWGVKFGGNFTVPLLNSIYYVLGDAPGNGKYSTKFGFQAGIVFEKEFFSDAKSQFLKRVVFAPELLYTMRSYGYTNSTGFKNDSLGLGISAAHQTATVKQTTIDLNPVFQYKIGNPNSNTFIPYLGFGPGISYTLSGTYTAVLVRSSGGGNSGPDVVSTAGLRKIVPSAIVSAGFKKRFNSVYVVVEARVQCALMNAINPSKRTIDQLMFDYGITPPNYKPLNFTVNAAIIVPQFKPRKLQLN